MELLLLLAFGIAIVVGVKAGRHDERGFQTSGESQVTALLMKRFRAPDYHLLNHVTLRVGDETTQIDHILVSRFGVFVIEAKDYNGWIFASERSRQWTQVLYRMRFRFQNPIHQNYKHLCTVRALLDFLPQETVKSVVVFTGSARFKATVPKGVVMLKDLTSYIERHAATVMSVNRLQFCVGRLETSRLAITQETDVEHVARLKRKYGGD
jgi:hypothetical protein